MRTITLLATLMGCQDYDVTGSGPDWSTPGQPQVPTEDPDAIDDNRAVDSFTVAAEPPIDILFAIHRSGSMQDDATNLGNAFASFIAEIGSRTTDWRVGVVTDDDGCFNGGMIVPSTVDYGSVFVAACEHPGIYGSFSEMLL